MLELVFFTVLEEAGVNGTVDLGGSDEEDTSFVR